ncbi:hypothetical protein [Rhizobium sp. KDH_Rht_773_N]
MVDLLVICVVDSCTPQEDGSSGKSRARFLKNRLRLEHFLKIGFAADIS